MSSQTCCLCIPIRTGVLIIACLGMIGGVYNIAQSVWNFIQLSRAENPDPDPSKSADTDITSSVILLTWGVVNILLSVMLWKGVTEQKPSFCRRWVLVNVITMAVLTTLFVGIIIWMAIASTAALALGIFILLIYAFLVAPTAYYVWVVQKYARILEVELYGTPSTIHGV